MKKIIIAVLCLAIVSGGGFFGYKKYQSVQDKKNVIDVIPINLIAESADSFSYTDSEMYGNITSADVQRVYIDDSKLIQNICVNKGDTVHKGDTILEYDMTLLELEIAQKENQVKVVRQNIKMAEKELAQYKTYKPSEDKPQPTESPTEPPTEPEPSVQTADLISSDFQSESGSGSSEDPFVINCNENTVVSAEFMNRIISEQLCAELRVYSDDSQYLYSWLIIAPDPESAEEWCVSDGVCCDPDEGLLTFDTSFKGHGLLMHSTAQYEDEYDSSDTDMPEISDTPEPEPDYGNDYAYTRAELKKMISAKESEIKQLNLELKQAEFDYQKELQKKEDGSIIAAIDGVVKKIGGSDSEQTENENEDEFDSGNMDSDAFAVIEGDGGAEASFTVSEAKLQDLHVGSRVSVMSYDSGAYSEAEITEISGEPVSYSNYNWGENPNNSTYQVYAKLDDSTDFSIGEFVSITSQTQQQETSSSVYLPIHYVRKENSSYYIMKTDENDRLVKQYVKTGQIMYGSYIEIQGGLKMSDKICFPYGTKVSEGARTKETTEILYPEY